MLARGSSACPTPEGALWPYLGLAFFYTRMPKQFASVSLFCLHVLCQRQIEQSDTVGCAKVRHPVSCAPSKREGAVKGRGLPSGELAAQRRSTSWTKKVQKRRSATICVDPARSHHLMIRSRKVVDILRLCSTPGCFRSFCFSHFEIFKSGAFPYIFTRRQHQNRIRRTEIALKMRSLPLAFASKMGDTLRMAVADGRHAVAGGVPPAGWGGPG
jgi:hypothetical protein